MKLIFGMLVVLMASSTFAHAFQQRLPPMSLSDIREDIRQIERPEEKLRTYIELSNRYLRNSPDSLLELAKEIEILEGISEDQREAFSSFLNANAYRLMNADSAIHFAGIASGKLKQLEEHDSYLMMENLRAMQYSRQDQYLEAESLFLSAISYKEELQDQVQYPIQYFYGNLGNLYVRVEAHDLAIKMFEKFLEYEDNPASRCNILSKLSSSFLKLKDYDKARSTLSPCLEFDNLPPPIKSMVRSNLSTIYEQEGDIETATYFLKQASAISSKYRIPNVSNSHIARLGNLYLDQNMISKADSVANTIINQPATSFSRPNEDIFKYQFLADLELAKNEYDQSIKYADEAIAISQKYNLPQMLRNTYSTRAKAYEALGEINQALENERLQREHDVAMNEQREKWSENMLSVRYQLQNKEAQLVDANLKLENIRVRNLLIIMGILMISGYIFYRYRLYYLLKEEKTRNRIARDLHDDLSGTLSSISFFSAAAKRMQEDPGESKRFLDIIDESASEAKEKINDIIWAIDPSKDDWEVFLKKCKRYAADMLDSHNISYDLQIDEDLSMPVTLEVRQNLWLIFKECIINLSRHSNAESATVILKEEKGKLKLVISDDGQGFNPEIIKNGNGVKNIRYRADLIDGVSHLQTAVDEGTTWTFTFNTN